MEKQGDGQSSLQRVAAQAMAASPRDSSSSEPDRTTPMPCAFFSSVEMSGSFCDSPFPAISGRVFLVFEGFLHLILIHLQQTLSGASKTAWNGSTLPSVG